MSIFRNYTTTDLRRLGFLLAIPSFVDPNKEESFSVFYNSSKDYFFRQMGPRPKPSSVKSDLCLGGQKKVKCKWGPKVFRVEYYLEVIFQNY